MKILFTFFLACSCFTNAAAQKVSKELIAEYEDTLKVMSHIIMNGEHDTIKQKANKGFIITLKEVLQYERSFNYPFDSLKTISIETSSDKRVKIYSWFLRRDNGSYNYFAFVHYHNKAKKRFEESFELEEDFPDRPTTPSAVFIDRCKHFKVKSPGKDWDRIWSMSTK